MSMFASRDGVVQTTRYVHEQWKHIQRRLEKGGRIQQCTPIFSMDSQESESRGIDNLFSTLSSAMVTPQSFPAHSPKNSHVSCFGRIGIVRRRLNWQLYSIAQPERFRCGKWKLLVRHFSLEINRTRSQSAEGDRVTITILPSAANRSQLSDKELQKWRWRSTPQGPRVPNLWHTRIRFLG
jgi:hypothetical protein